jgi:hypothetical protein
MEQQLDDTKGVVPELYSGGWIWQLMPSPDINQKHDKES